MATERVWTCSADGLEDDGVTATDYSDPQLWDDTEAYDAVAADEIPVLEFFSHASGVFSGTGNLLTINAGWTTDDTRFIWLRFRAGQGHDGAPPTNYLYTITNNGMMVETEGSGIFCLVEGLTFRMNGSGVNFSSMVNATDSSNCWADACLAVVDNHSNGTGSEMFNGGGGSGSRNTRFFVRNCISIDNNGNLNKHVSLIDPSAGSGKREIYNNTFIGGVNGIHDDGFTLNAEVVIKNNIVQGTSSADYELTGTPVTADNISSDATSPDGASFQNITLTFADAANDNYHLASGDTDAIDAGEDLTTEFQAFPHGTSVDIDGDPRPTGAGTWDIGADEIVSAGPTEQAVSATASGTATLSTTSSLSQSISATATGSAALAAAATVQQLLSATATATASLSRKIGKNLQATAAAAASLSRATSKTLSASATAAASLTSGQLLSQTISASGSAAAALATKFTAKADRVMLTLIHWLFRRRRRR